MLIRIRKQDIQSANWVKPDPLDECLACWKIWIAGDGDRDLGAKTMSGMVGLKDAYGVDLGEAQHARDNRIGAATDAMIDSLKQIHRWAIYTSCSVVTAWKYPHADVIEVATEARAVLTLKLKNNVCTGALF